MPQRVGFGAAMDIGISDGVGARSPVGGDARPDGLRLLTLNLGLLGFRLAGTRFIAMAEHVERRLAAAPRQLLATAADIVVLQEIYDRRHRRYLTRALRDAYPYAAGVGDRWSVFSNGLLILSRYPIVERGYSVAPGFRFHERIVSRKGYLQVELAVPEIGRLRLIDIHLTVSGMFFPSAGKIDDRRRRQEIDHLLQLAGMDGEKPAILVGDFNCSPDVHGDHYRRIVEAGYVDSYTAAGSGGDGFTWDVENALNRNGPYKNSPSQRIDHVLIPKAMLTRLNPRSASVVLNSPAVPVGDGHVTLSDHYGMLVDLVAVESAVRPEAARVVAVPAE